MSNWIRCVDKLPADFEPVLLLVKKERDEPIVFFAFLLSKKFYWLGDLAFLSKGIKPIIYDCIAWKSRPKINKRTLAQIESGKFGE